jgi:hypothetical protein
VPQRPSDPPAWDALRAICAELPDVTERTSHGELAWFVGNGSRARQFAGTWDHHHDDRNAVVMAAAPGVQQQLVDTDPSLYFRPPYVGAKGWIGMFLDAGPVDWDLVAVHLGDAYAIVRQG